MSEASRLLSTRRWSAALVMTMSLSAVSSSRLAHNRQRWPVLCERRKIRE